jgi:hypothetical protein
LNEWERCGLCADEIVGSSLRDEFLIVVAEVVGDILPCCLSTIEQTLGYHMGVVLSHWTDIIRRRWLLVAICCVILRKQQLLIIGKV